MNGPIPKGMDVLHRCDNPPCINPEHLFLGTQADNNADRDAKGRCRVAHGEKQHAAKLTQAQVLAIREDRRSQRKIAAAYHVNQGTISSIKLRKTWRHV
jgi:hypothetical protein